ncbi:MAG: hypothetical protein ABGX08_17365 [Citromicrobium sp.]
MGKRKSRRAFNLDADIPTPEQLADGSYERDFITHAETNTKAMAYRKRDSTIVEKWIREGATGFDIPAQRAIADCIVLWARMGSPNVTANYGERVAASPHSDGHVQQDAADEIAFRKTLVPRPYWDVFENVLRHNEPAGVAGSSFANNKPQQIASARTIVGMVANIIAMRCGY